MDAGSEGNSTEDCVTAGKHHLEVRRGFQDLSFHLALATVLKFDKVVGFSPNNHLAINKLRKTLNVTASILTGLLVTLWLLRLLISELPAGQRNMAFSPFGTQVLMYCR